MPMLVTKEERKVIKDQWISENSPIIIWIEKKILKYMASKEEATEKNIVEFVFCSDDRIERSAENIGFMLATLEKGEKPIQSVGGMMVGFLKPSDLIEDAYKAMHVAMELLMTLDPIVKISISKNGHLMVETMISDEKLIMKNIYLPLENPMFQHDRLGNFRWRLTETEALDKLNLVPLRLALLNETEEHLPGKNDFSPEAQKQRELWKKQRARAALYETYKGKPVYLNWASDYRGRMYAVGYYTQVQGTEIEKNSIELFEGKKLDIHGEFQLKASIASAYGLDKKTNMEKIDWFRNHVDRLEEMEVSAKEPYTYQYLVRAWNDHLAGKEVHQMVELDSTQSQLQMLSVLLHNKKMAKACNVALEDDATAIPQIADAYDKVAKEMTNAIMAAELMSGTSERFGKIHRREVKKSMMIFGYGAGRKRIETQLKEDFGDRFLEGLYDLLIDAMKKVAPGMIEIRDFINGLWNPDWTEVKYTMPDGFEVTIKPTSADWFDFSLFGSFQLKAKVGGVRKENASLLLFVTIIHSLDAYVCREVVKRCDFPVLTIHDAFRCHPSDAHKMRKVYREVMADINDTDLLGDILTQITGTSVSVPFGDLKREDILNSVYAIC